MHESLLKGKAFSSRFWGWGRNRSLPAPLPRRAPMWGCERIGGPRGAHKGRARGDRDTGTGRADSSILPARICSVAARSKGKNGEDLGARRAAQLLPCKEQPGGAGQIQQYGGSSEPEPFRGRNARGQRGQGSGGAGEGARKASVPGYRWGCARCTRSRRREHPRAVPRNLWSF